MAKTERHLGATRADDDDEKAYPATVASLFASLRQYWASHVGDKPTDYRMVTDEFRTQPPPSFCDAFDYVAENFPKLDRVDDDDERKYSSAADAFYDIETGGKTRRLDYEQIVTAAQWTGLSAAQFLMFCHFASTERRADNEGRSSHDALQNRLADYEAVLSELRTILDEKEEQHVFYEPKPNHQQKFYVKEDLLLRLGEVRKRFLR